MLKKHRAGRLRRLVNRTKLFFNPSNIAITGKCNKCGMCCRNLILCTDDRTIRTEEEFVTAKTKHPEYDMFDIRSVNDDGDLVFICRHIAPDNSCSIHAKRPGMCRKYPTKEMITRGGRLLDGCGYRIEPIVGFDEMIDSQ